MKVLSILACSVALILLAACGSTPSQQATTPTAVNAAAEVTQTPATLPTDTVPAEPAPTATTAVEPTATAASVSDGVGAVGNTLELIGPDDKPSGLKITLNSVRRSEGSEYFKPKEGHVYLIVDITIENTSDKDAPVSSLLFTGVKDSTGQEYNQSLFGTDKSAPNGTIPPGDLLRGEVAFEIPTDATGLTFSYDMGFGSKPVRFNLDTQAPATTPAGTPAAEAAPTAVSSSEAPAPEAGVGSTLKSGDFEVTLNGVRRGTDGFVEPDPGMVYLIVDVTISNVDSEEHAVSSVMNFSVKDGTGQKYSQSIGADTKDSPNGDIAAGDKLRGEIGFEVPETATGLYLIYDPVFGGESVRFQLDK